MRILIGYDGSKGAEAAVTDLRRAGLPAEAETVVLSVRELWAPSLTGYGVVEGDLSEGGPMSPDPIAAAMESARARIEADHPGWSVLAETGAGVPGRVILEEAERLRVDLVVVGSHGRTALGRLILGSVSQKVAVEAACSVRVARERLEETDGPVRVLLGLKGAPSSDDAVHAVASRPWPAGTEVRLVTAVGPGALLGPRFDSLLAELKEQHEAAMAELAAAGLRVSSVVIEGDPRRLVPEIAETWGADCIFVGTRDLTREARAALGSVSSAVLARAHCTVEIARPR